MGPIKRFRWKRRFKGKVSRRVHTAHLLQTIAKLDLWVPSKEAERAFEAVLLLHETLKNIVDELVEDEL